VTVSSKETVHTKLVCLFNLYIYTQFHMHRSSGLFLVPIRPKVDTIFTGSSTLLYILQKSHLNRLENFWKISSTFLIFVWLGNGEGDF